jgi:histidinol phosphatase-like enzyme
MNLDMDLMLQALSGDEQATKIYCGSYKLVMITEKSGMYRTKEIKSPMIEVKTYMDKPVYDKDGFLHPVFWSLPRI